MPLSKEYITFCQILGLIIFKRLKKKKTTHMLAVYTSVSEDIKSKFLPQKLMTLLTLICLLTSLEHFLPQVPL